MTHILLKNIKGVWTLLGSITFTGTNATGSIITNDLEYGYNSVLTLIRPSVDNGSGEDTYNVPGNLNYVADDNVDFIIKSNED